MLPKFLRVMQTFALFPDAKASRPQPHANKKVTLHLDWRETQSSRTVDEVACKCASPEHVLLGLVTVHLRECTYPSNEIAFLRTCSGLCFSSSRRHSAVVTFQ